MPLLASLLLTISLQVSGWEAFSNTNFIWLYDESFGAEVIIPTFDDEVKKLDGKEITISGHYLPFKLGDNRIIISRLPYASCFFCNADVGQESVAEVVFKSEPRRFRPDEIITVRGRLLLNEDDFERMVFIIEEAEIIQS